MTWTRVVVRRFGGPEVLDLEEVDALPVPGGGEVRLKVLAAGTGFTDTFIRRGRYPDFKGPLPFTPGYDLVGTVDALGPGVTRLAVGQRVAELAIVGGYAQYAIRGERDLVPVPDDVDPAEAVCIPLAYLTAYQMLVRCCHLERGARILVVGASGTVGTALLDLARDRGLVAIGTASAKNLDVIRGYGAEAIDYKAEDFVERVAATGGVDAAFDAMGGSHFRRSFACLHPGGRLVGYGSQTMAVGGEGLVSAALGLLRLNAWGALPWLFGGRSATFYSITARRRTHHAEYVADMKALFALLRERRINPIVVERLGLSEARRVHERIDAGGLGGKVVLLPWAQP
jgi:NADPH:quinone reductase-like Zn-dependent oxidoreductase